MKIESRDKQVVVDEEIEITITLPRWQVGKETYGEGEYKVGAYCICIDEDVCHYSLSHQIYLDYKDSLQVGNYVLIFDSKEQAEEFGRKHNLNIHYI